MSPFLEAILAAGQGHASANEDGWLCREFRFTAEFPGFAGHFPDKPVLPALAQLLCGASVAAMLPGRTLEPTGVRNARFLAPVQPGERILVCARQIDPAAVEVRAAMEGRTASTFILEYPSRS